MSTKQSELSVITKAKNLSSYIFTITRKSPKQFRFTLVARLQNYSLDIIEHIYRANDTYVRPGDIKKADMRRDSQAEAMTYCRLLTHVAQLSMVQVSVSAPIRTVENKRIVASYGFIHTPVDLIGVFFV